MAGHKRLKTHHSPEKDVKGRHKIILAVDFGTTFTGVGYATTDKNKDPEITIVTTWPGQLATAWKTPTRIAYYRENTTLAKNKWGFEVQSKHVSYSWTKLLLDKNAAPGDFDDPALAQLKAEGLIPLPDFRTAAGVCEDFLREVYVYVSEKLERQLGSATFDLTPMECWITLPAIWSEEAKYATLRAAKSAGFGGRTDDEVFTIAEPEAAAIATLKLYSQVGTVNAVKANERILICDCGGGTTDITTYTILSVEPQLSFDELCVGVGGKCGSTYIDRNLHTLLSMRFGEAFQAVPDINKGPGSRFMACFEEIKRSFGLDHDQGGREVYPLKMEVEDSEFYDEEERIVKLTYDDMQALFDPVVQEVIKLVNQQVVEARVSKKTKIDRIILVGGFGDSAYLNQELKKWCESHGKIQLMCPDNPQAAVVRGAALRGLEYIAPQTKQSRRHFGYRCGVSFRDGIDPEDESYIVEYSGLKYCDNRSSWSINKGEAIIRDTYRSFKLMHRHTRGSAVAVNILLYSCAANDAPERVTDPGVEYVGKVVGQWPADFDFGQALSSKYSSRLGKMVYQLDLEIQVVFGNKGDNLTFRTAINGKVNGTADIEFKSSV